VNSLYEDSVPGDLRVMYYRVLAKNRFGGESDLSEPVRAVTKAEPLPPIGLAVRERSLGRVDLVWEPNVELDVAGYEIWRSAIAPERKGPLEQIGTVERGATGFSDTTVDCGVRVRYRLRAVDRDGLVSAFSGPLEVESVGLDLAFEAPGALTWSAERLGPGAGIRIVRERSWLPDQTLPLDRGDARANLAALAPGLHRLVAVIDLPPTATAEPREIRCDLRLSLPPGPS
jgi:hypothetical protein